MFKRFRRRLPWVAGLCALAVVVAGFGFSAFAAGYTSHKVPDLYKLKPAEVQMLKPLSTWTADKGSNRVKGDFIQKTQMLMFPIKEKAVSNTWHKVPGEATFYYTHVAIDKYGRYIDATMKVSDVRFIVHRTPDSDAKYFRFFNGSGLCSTALNADFKIDKPDGSKVRTPYSVRQKVTVDFAYSDGSGDTITSICQDMTDLDVTTGDKSLREGFALKAGYQPDVYLHNSSTIVVRTTYSKNDTYSGDKGSEGGEEAHAVAFTQGNHVEMEWEGPSGCGTGIKFRGVDSFGKLAPTYTKSLEIRDTDLETGDIPQGIGTLEGISFEIVNDNKYPIVAMEAGRPKEVAAGGVIETVKLVHEDGKWKAIGNVMLPSGKFRLRQIMPENSEYKKAKDITFTVDNSKASSAVKLDVKNEIKRSAFDLQKRDAQTGDVAQGMATLKGAKFDIKFVSKDANPIVVDGKTYKVGDVVMTGLTTDEKGNISTGAKLPAGTYEIIEVNPPAGYSSRVFVTKGDGCVGSFGADNDGRAICTVDLKTDVESLAVKFPNKIAETFIDLTLRDKDFDDVVSQGDANLTGAEFEVRYAGDADINIEGVSYHKGDVVKTLKPDEYGATSTVQLPPGSYELYQTKAGTGYTFDKDWVKKYDLSFDGEGVSPVVHNKVIRGGVLIQKLDGDTGTAMPALKGAQFDVIYDGANPVYIEGSTYRAGDVVAHLSTDESGVAQCASKFLPYGTYHLVETVAPDGYIKADTWEPVVKIRENGVSVEQNLVNSLGRGSIYLTKYDVLVGFKPKGKNTGMTKGQASATLAGAQFSIYNLSGRMQKVAGKDYKALGNIVMPAGNTGKLIPLSSIKNAPSIDKDAEAITTITTNKDGKASFSGLPVGVYVIREVKAPKGYKLNPDWKGGMVFAITHDGEIVGK